MAKTLLFLTLVLLSSSMIYSQKFLGEKTDIFQCISDVTNLKTEIQTFLAQNVTIEALIQEFEKLEPMFETTFADCGIANVSIHNIISPNTEKIPISIDFLACLSDLNTIATLLSEVVSDIGIGNFANVLQDLAKLRTAAVALATDCTTANSTVSNKGRVLTETSNILVGGALDCFSDITDHLVPDLEAFVNVSKSGQIQDIIAALNVLVGDANTVVADCQLGDSEEVRVALQHLNTISPVECLSDIENLVNLAETIIQNYNNSQYEELISNLLQFVNEAQQTITDCTGSNVTLTETKDFIKANAQNIECAGEFNGLAKELRNLIAAPKTEKLLRTQNVFESFQHLIQTCGNQDCPVLKRIIKINVFACVQDVENLVTVATQTLSDAESYNIIAVISDVEQLVSLVETAVADCTGSNLTTTQKATIDVFQCINDVEVEVQAINNLLQSISAGNITDILPQISNIVNNLDPLLEDCGLNSTLADIAKKVKINPEECINDVSDVVNVVNQVIADYQAQNWSQLAEDVLNAVERVQQLAGDCFNYNLTSFVSGSCVADVENLVQDVITVVDRISHTNETYEDIMEIIEMVYNVVEEIGTLETDCGLKLDAVVKNRNSLVLLAEGNTCWGSITKLGEAVLDLASGTDIIEKIAKLNDIKKYFEEVKVNCLGMKASKTQDAIVSYVQVKALRL